MKQSNLPEDNSYKIQYNNPQDETFDVRYGTGFLVGENLLLTLPHVVRSCSKGKNIKLLVYPHNSIQTDPVEFKLVNATDKLALLKCEEGTAFQGKYIPWKRAYREIRRSEKATAWGFMKEKQTKIDLGMKCSDYASAPKDQYDPEYANEYYNVHFQSETNQPLNGLSGSPIIQGNCLIGILGSQMRADCTRPFGLCGEEFYQELEKWGIQFEIDPASLLKSGLPHKFPCQCPERHHRLLNEVLSKENTGPVFITGPVGTGKSWLAMEFGNTYKKGHVLHISFSKIYKDTYDRVEEEIASHCAEFPGEKPINSLCQNDLVIIEHADLPNGYLDHPSDYLGYDDLCKLPARVIITTDQIVPYDNVSCVELDSWTPSELDLLFGQHYKFNSADPEVSEWKGKLFSAVDYNPLLLDMVLQEICCKCPSVKEAVSVFPDIDFSSFNKDVTCRRHHTEIGTFTRLLRQLFDPHENLTNEEKEVIVLAQANSGMKTERFKKCLSPFKFDKYLNQLLHKGMLCENQDGELCLPIVSRLICEAEKFTAQEITRNVFKNELRKLEKEECQLTPAQVLLKVTDATNTTEYRAFFKNPPSVSGASAEFRQDLETLRQFDSIMNSVYDTCDLGRDYSREVNVRLLKGYQALCILYKNEREARQIFWTKYYDLFERIFPNRAEMEDCENPQTTAKCRILQTFLSVEFSENLPNDAPRLLLLSIYYGNLNNNEKSDKYARQAREKYEADDSAHKHLFANVYIQLGESANAQRSYRVAVDYFKDAQGILLPLPENASPFWTFLAAVACLRHALCLVKKHTADSMDAPKKQKDILADLTAARMDAEKAMKFLDKVSAPHSKQFRNEQINCRALLINIHCAQSKYSSCPVEELDKADSLLTEMKREYDVNLKIYQKLEVRIRECRTEALVGVPS